MLCSGCYERSRIGNTKTSVTLADLATLRWKCGSCEEGHAGPCLDLGYDEPYYWRDEYGSVAHQDKPEGRTFLTGNYCAIDDKHFFVRGIVPLPILGSAEHFCWGVWGSLNRDNFRPLVEKDDDPARAGLPPMFSWLSTRIPEYPDTLNLKM